MSTIHPQTAADDIDHAVSNQSPTERMTGAVNEAQKSVQKVAEDVRTGANNVLSQGTDHARTAQSEFDTAVRRNPTVAVLGALGVGVLLGVALNKRA